MGVNKRLAFVSPQGTMFLKDDLYMKKQGSTAENGGQVIYVIEMARSLITQGHKVDIFARNYDSDKLEIEKDPDFEGLRIFHVPTSAPREVQKEEFYGYYPEYLGRMIQAVEDPDNDCHYDSIVGHYADGMFLGAGLERHLAHEHGLNVPMLGITHSLGVEKARSLHTTLQSKPGIDLKKHFGDAVERYNIKPRLGCELTALAHCDAMIGVSEAHMADLYDHYNVDEDRIAIIPGGINDKIFSRKNIPLVTREQMVAELAAQNRDDITETALDNMRSGKLIFGFGRMVRAKGVLNAVIAMEEILKKNPDAVYVYAGGTVAGKTPEELGKLKPEDISEEKSLLEDCLNYAVTKGYRDRIVFLGRQDQPKIAQWLTVSNVYAHCAGLEPFGLAPQEAAATGIPVVISKLAGVAEVLDNNIKALHVDPHSTSDIAKQIGRVLSNPEMGHRLATEAVRYIESNATWSARADQLTSFIDAEVSPRYFARRAERQMNGNMYKSHAELAITARNFGDIDELTAGHAVRARDIMVHMLKTGLPERDSPEIRLDFDAQRHNHS